MASSARVGGDAPARAQVQRGDEAGEARRPSTRGSASARSARPSPRSDHQASQPPENASPAPIVSTTSTGGAGDLHLAVAGEHDRAVAAARQQDDRRPPVEQRARGVDGGHARREPGEVVVGDLDDVREREHAPEPRPVRGRVGDRPRGGSSGRPSRSARRRPGRGERLERGGHRLEHEPERADVQDTRRRRAARRARRPRSGPAPTVPSVVEAVARGAPRSSSSTSASVVGSSVRTMRVEAHAVGGQQLGEPRPEAVGRDPAQVGDRALEPAERAGGVERPAAGVRGERARPPPGTRSISASPATTMSAAPSARAQRYCSRRERGSARGPAAGGRRPRRSRRAARRLPRARAGRAGRVRHLRASRHVARRLLHRGARRRDQRRGLPLPVRAGDERAAVPRPRHARAVGARVPHDRRGARRARRRRRGRRRRRRTRRRR